MGAIGGLFGTAGGVNGTGFNLTNGTNSGQLQTAYGGAQNSLQSQQALLSALQGQNGIGNQSQVYNQLQGVANGTGPNPAQAQLAQATGQNVANQAALMAGQRGAGANVGLLARQAAQQGAQTQQNAIGQAATLQAQQSLNALNAAGNLANTQAANQIGATSANTQAQQNEQQILQGANSQMNAIQGGLANTTMQGQQGVVGGAMQGIGQALTLPQFASGGVVQKFADGGPTLGVSGVDPAPQSPFNLGVDTNLAPSQPLMGPQSSAGQYLSPQNNTASNPAPISGGQNSGAQALAAGMSGIIGSGSKSVGNLIHDLPAAAAAFSRGGNVGPALKAGGKVPGKAPVAGNSYKNDIVRADLSPGELVVDRETMADHGPAGQAARFLAAVIQAKKKGRK
jgi:hypothetical protein